MKGARMPWVKKVDSKDIPSKEEAVKRKDEIVERIEGLAIVLAEVKADLATTSTRRRLQRELDGLKEEISKARIEKSETDEAFARERREIEHHVGLERQRTELEIENAKKEAALDAREQNLSGKEDLFEEHMAFYKEQMDKHIDDVKSLLNQVMTRIPTVNVDRRIRETHEIGPSE